MTQIVDNDDSVSEELRSHQDEIGELYDADPTCWHVLDEKCWSGVKCLKCGGWFCH